MTSQYLGNKELLIRKLTAFLASRTVQTAQVMACYDWATSLSAESDCVVSGFQSPIERDVLHLLLKRRVPVIVVLSRVLYKEVPDELKEAFEDDRVLFISNTTATRSNKALARARNLYVAELASAVVFGMVNEESSLYDIFLKLKEEKQLVRIHSADSL